jgi:hypothetical protein
MAYKYSDSEKFRANVFFVSGMAFCAPLGNNVIFISSTSNLPKFEGVALSIVLFLFGFYLVCKSYDIVFKKDNFNA